MIIPIPVATQWVATAQGTAWKVVTCSHCRQQYAFLLELETTGTEVGPPLSLGDEGARRAQARAEENLSKMARNVVFPLPCPNCGCYQPDMVDLLRTEGTSNAPLIAGLIVAVLSLIPLAFSFSVPYIWVATVAGVSAGLGLIGYADWRPPGGTRTPATLSRGRPAVASGRCGARNSTVCSPRTGMPAPPRPRERSAVRPQTLHLTPTACRLSGTCSHLSGQDR